MSDALAAIRKTIATLRASGFNVSAIEIKVDEKDWRRLEYDLNQLALYPVSDLNDVRIDGVRILRIDAPKPSFAVPPSDLA